jgi:hypothetical protein
VLELNGNINQKITREIIKNYSTSIFENCMNILEEYNKDKNVLKFKSSQEIQIVEKKSFFKNKSITNLFKNKNKLKENYDDNDENIKGNIIIIKFY